MEFAEAVKIREKMCEYYYNNNCLKCPLSEHNNGTKLTCDSFIGTYPDEAEEIIIKWAEENLAKTNGQHFLEEFPVAYVSTREYNSDGIEMVYVKPNLPDINYCMSFPAKWWDKEYEEVEKKCK